LAHLSRNGVLRNTCTTRETDPMFCGPFFDRISMRLRYESRVDPDDRRQISSKLDKKSKNGGFMVNFL